MKRMLLVALLLACGPKQPGARVEKEALYDAREVEESVWTVKDAATGVVHEVAKVDLTPLGLPMEEQVRVRRLVVHGKMRCRGTIREIGEPAVRVLYVTAVEEVK